MKEVGVSLYGVKEVLLAILWDAHRGLKPLYISSNF